MIETHFRYKDEFGQEAETRKTYVEDAIEVTPAIELLFADFVSHLRNCGFADSAIQEQIEFYSQNIDK